MTSFLSSVEQNIVASMLPKNIHVEFDGGYPDAQRKIACFIPDGMEFSVDLVCLRSSYDSRFKKLTHSDVLGCLMHSGIEREVIGDIIVEDCDIYVFCKKKIASYIQNQCVMIGRCPISFHESIDSVSFTQNKEQFTITCSSLRLDSMVAILSHCSRSDALKKIHAGFVKVNDVVLEQNVQLCNNDFVSIRKTGRFQFLKVVSKTKKDKLVLLMDKFI